MAHQQVRDVLLRYNFLIRIHRSIICRRLMDLFLALVRRSIHGIHLLEHFRQISFVFNNSEEFDFSGVNMVKFTEHSIVERIYSRNLHYIVFSYTRSKKLNCHENSDYNIAAYASMLRL